VVREVDGHNANAIKHAVEEAPAVSDNPSLLLCKTVIGFGSPNKAGTHDSHGLPLGDEIMAYLAYFFAPATHTTAANVTTNIIQLTFS
jgi:transketolase